MYFCAALFLWVYLSPLDSQWLYLLHIIHCSTKSILCPYTLLLFFYDFSVNMLKYHTCTQTYISVGLLYTIRFGIPCSFYFILFHFCLFPIDVCMDLSFIIFDMFVQYDCKNVNYDLFNIWSIVENEKQYSCTLLIVKLSGFHSAAHFLLFLSLSLLQPNKWIVFSSLKEWRWAMEWKQSFQYKSFKC